MSTFFWNVVQERKKPFRNAYNTSHPYHTNPCMDSVFLLLWSLLIHLLVVLFVADCQFRNNTIFVCYAIYSLRSFSCIICCYINFQCFDCCIMGCGCLFCDVRLCCLAICGNMDCLAMDQDVCYVCYMMVRMICVRMRVDVRATKDTYRMKYI